MKDNYILTNALEIVFSTDERYSNWFGYYNYDPLDYSNSKLLCNKAGFDRRAITDTDTIELGWYDIYNGKWNRIGETSAFNWQQGAMLQWVPNQNNKVIYNCVNGLHYNACIYDVISGEKRLVDFPIYTVHPSGKFALSLNYERSYWCRAYHYQPIKNKALNVRVPKEDGIYKVDLCSGSIDKIVDINDVIHCGQDSSFDFATHWLEHLMINKDGTRIVFLHRYSIGDVNYYKTRVCACSIDGKNLKIISEWDTLQWSHIGWLNENQFVAYTYRMPTYTSAKDKFEANRFVFFIAKKLYTYIIRPLLSKRMRDKLSAVGSYRLYTINNVEICESSILKNIGEIDGHPSFTNDGKYMITDTYPDENGYQHLLVYSMDSNNCMEIGRFFAPLRGTPASCDLHPKLCGDNSMLIVDTACSGIHRMMVFRIRWNEIKEKLK